MVIMREEFTMSLEQAILKQFGHCRLRNKRRSWTMQLACVGKPPIDGRLAA